MVSGTGCPVDAKVGLDSPVQSLAPDCARNACDPPAAAAAQMSMFGGAFGRGACGVCR